MIKETKFGRCTIDRGEDGSYTCFNHDLYNKIRKVKGEKSIKDSHYNGHRKGFIENFHLCPTIGSGKKYIANDKTYYVDSAYKHWDRGYYIMLLTYTITDNGKFSHSNLYYKNINSHSESIQEYCKENKDIEFLDSSLEEKINIIIENRSKRNLPTIIHLSDKDAENYNTVKISDAENINELIKQHNDNKEPLILSGSLSWVEKQFTNFSMNVIHIDGFVDESYADILYLHREMEEILIDKN